MQDMRNLNEAGLISDEYMEKLEEHMKHDQSLENFKNFMEEKVATHTKEPRKVSGGNKSIKTRSQRKRHRKNQRKARKVTS